MPVQRLAFLIAIVIAAAGLTVYGVALFIGTYGAYTKIAGILGILAMGIALGFRKVDD